MLKDRFCYLRDSTFRILPHVFTNEFSSLSITGEIKIGSRTKDDSEAHLEIWDFWFCFDRFRRRGKTFPVNTIAGMASLSLLPPSNRNLHCASSWALEKLSTSTHLARVCRKKKNVMPSVFLPPFYSKLQSLAACLSHNLVNRKLRCFVACLRILFTIKRGRGDDVIARGKKKAPLSQSPTFPGVWRSQISSSLAPL